MIPALSVLALVAAALLLSSIVRAAARTRRKREGKAQRRPAIDPVDPGRERRAEQRARELLRSCVNEEEWAMYRDLGFVRVPGRRRPRDPTGQGTHLGPGQVEAVGPSASVGADQVGWRGYGGPGSDAARSRTEPPYAYLIYPHKPIVSYVPGTQRLLSEYCVEFPDLAGAISESRLPDSDDVLAKWMAVTGDESRLLGSANMHLPGRQIDPARVRRDLWRLAEWERQRRGPNSVEASQP